MKPSEALLSSFDRSWTEFSTAWKRARAKASAKSIHNLRVNTRRLIAGLEFMRSISRNAEIAKLQRRFKKILKSMGSLRDLQVQWARSADLRQVEPIMEFRRALQRRENRQVANISKKLKRGTKHRLNSDVKEARSSVARIYEKSGDARIRTTVERTVRSHKADFLKKRKQFQSSDVETLHEMRIALKKFRYTIECALPVLGPSASEQAKRMHSLQQLLGDFRDLELLGIRLEKWAVKRGKKIAVVPALETLDEKRQELMNKIIESMVELDEHISEEQQIKPAVETTLAIDTGSGADSDSADSVPRVRRVAAGR
jgi:CHAD domain-containing protein